MSAGNVCDCIGAIGASGTGKGLYVTSKVMPLLGSRPVLVWSPLEATDQYGKKFRGVVVRSIPELVKRVKAGAPAVVFVPSMDPKMMEKQFDLFCRVVWHTPKAVALVEELSRVTSPSWAPAPWQNLSTAGRHQGVTVIGTAQRPAQMDKDFLGNCTEVRAYRVNYEPDAKALASVMRAAPELFLELPDRSYLHRWIRERRWQRGVQPLPGGTVEVIAEGEGAHVTSPEAVTPIRVTPAPAAQKKSARKAKKSR